MGFDEPLSAAGRVAAAELRQIAATTRHISTFCAFMLGHILRGIFCLELSRAILRQFYLDCPFPQTGIPAR